ncbi:MAG TPA: FAD-dependent oxidoreductase [Acidobacteriaceae bacterium]|nr:FAD-dependent oxidoreductase [Acidobacteriaceae bacterium]
MGLTRRNFLMRIGQLGGYSAAFTMMQSLGLLPLPEIASEMAKLNLVEGAGTSVVILGGGIAGLVTAYELSRAGYRCTVLEARERPGGRNWTIRGGTKVEFNNGFNQTCEFSGGMYFNAGPARLPSIHRTMLHYCSELDVPLEVEVNSSRCDLMQADSLNGGMAVQNRRVVNDTRGHVSALLAKAINQGALNQDITKEDKEKMLAFLIEYGDLKPDYLFKGTARSGYKVFPGAEAQPPVPNDPLPMDALLDADLWRDMLAEEVPDWQPTMFEPIGGMDRIPYAFKTKLGSIVRYSCPVKSIRQSTTGVTVTYASGGSTHTITADYCVCAMPLTILKTLDTDFSPAVDAVINGSAYDSAYKIAWESPRFWETEYAIYGGLGYLKQTVGTIWYPSGDLFSPKGIVVAGYGVENGSAFGKLPTVQAKLDASRHSIELLHPGHSKDLTKPVYISWGHIPYNLGSWIHRYGNGYVKGYDTLLVPDRRVYFAGDHTSHLVGWQEGAALSAYRVINQLGVRIQNGGQNAA